MATDPERLDLASHDIAADKREELLRLFPEARTEGGKIDFERLQRALGETVDAGRERYGMTWPGKADCFKAIQTPSMATLLPCPEESVNWDRTENLIIEGDNLEVLKLLQKSYLGKVKMIYIDPPYNTGNDFIYPDNYSETLQTYLEYTGQVDTDGKKFNTNSDTDGRFHSKWMNMMYPRLYLGRNLLREDGFLVVSIDDQEVSNCRAILNEVFGEENFVAVLVFDRNRKNDAKLFSVGHEYMLVYARSYQRLKELGLRLRAPKEGIDDVRAEFDRLRLLHGNDWDAVSAGLRDFYKTFEDDDPRAPLSRYTKADDRGPYRTDGDASWPGGDGPTYEVLHPVTGKACKTPSRGWVWPTYQRMKQEIDKGNLVFGIDEKTIPSVRRDLFDKSNQVMRSVIFSYAQKASQDFAEIFDGKKVFDNPKSFVDLHRLVSYLSEPGDLILDFFAGSGTTGHGAMLANQDDEGGRRFILVQLPEPLDGDSEAERNARALNCQTVADITRERTRRVIGRLDAATAGQLDLGFAQSNLGFRAFSLSDSNITPWQADMPQDPEALTQQLELHIDHVRDDRKPLDMLFEILLRSGYPLTAMTETLTLEGKEVHSIANGALRLPRFPGQLVSWRIMPHAPVRCTGVRARQGCDS